MAFGFCRCLRLCVCVSTTWQLFKLGFGPKMQNTLVKVPVVLCTDRPWPLRSNLTWKSKFTPYWACPHHNSSPIQARITKFGPEVRNTLFKIPIVVFFVSFFFGGGAIALDLQGKIWLKSQIFRSQHYWKYIPTNITIRASWLSRLFHWPDCFAVSVSILCM